MCNVTEVQKSIMDSESQRDQKMRKERVSIIIPVYNGEEFIEECLRSIDNQNLQSEDDQLHLELEVSIFDDASTDGSSNLIDKWKETTCHASIITTNRTSRHKGAGHARNQAIQQSTGQYLCFCDADDIMEPERVIRQYLLALKHPNAIIGSRFIRRPEDSGRTSTFWANNLKDSELTTQIYLTFGPTLILPTWFFHRGIYERIAGGFDESGKTFPEGTHFPEDLVFYYKHLDNGGELVQANEALVIYRYHQSSTTFSISETLIESIRLARLEREVLSKWDKFSIWNAGKRGRRFYRSLKQENQNKVLAFCDVDQNKIDQKTYHPYPLNTRIPIIHAEDVSPPLIICVKADIMWDDAFRKILDSLKIIEGKDFVYFN